MKRMTSYRPCPTRLSRMTCALALLTTSLALAGCQTTNGDGMSPALNAAVVAKLRAQLGPRVSCAAWKPITWSAADTRLTAEQVAAHNAVGKKLCGWSKAGAH